MVGRARRRAVAAAVALVLVGCATTQTTSSGTVGVSRGQTMLVSSEQVNQSAAKAYVEVLQQARTKGQLDRDPGEVGRVRTVAQRLIPATAAFRQDAPGWHWEAHVISASDINAWCMPGGKIAVYTALMERLQLTDAELAAVMGHEIAHALREHGREKASQAAEVGIVAMGVGLLGALYGIDPQASQNIVGTVGDLAFMRPNSRGMEQEADRIGVELAARAGYDPRAALTLWQKMAKASNGQPPQWLSTHPSHESRQADLAEYARRVMPLYEATQRR